MPLYVKSGCLLPLALPVTHVGRGTTFQLTVKVYGPNPAPFTLYEDDGESFDYEKNVQNRITLTWDGTKGAISREGGYAGSPRYMITSWKAG
jgi:alpha-D-xyloside xylohydrolase